MPSGRNSTQPQVSSTFPHLASVFPGLEAAGRLGDRNSSILKPDITRLASELVGLVVIGLVGRPVAFGLVWS